jgi:hypothetical protein
MHYFSNSNTRDMLVVVRGCFVLIKTGERALNDLVLVDGYLDIDRETHLKSNFEENECRRILHKPHMVFHSIVWVLSAMLGVYCLIFSTTAQ